MKKIIVTLAVLLLAAPAMAGVDISAAVTGPNEVTVTLNATGEAELVRAIALDVQVTDPNAWIEDVNCVSAGYYISPTNVQISPQGEMSDPESDDCAAVIDGNLTITEQGSLYAELDPAPDQSQDLFIITLGGCTLVEGGDVTLTISENALRGGIVMEDTGAPAAQSLTGVVVNIGECPGCSCMGDVDESTTVNFGDLMAIYGEMINQYPNGDNTFVYEIGNPVTLPCGDVDDSGSINFSDLMMIYGEMINQYPNGDNTFVYEIGCPF